jgi:hypothetical protein
VAASHRASIAFNSASDSGSIRCRLVPSTDPEQRFCIVREEHIAAR